MNFDTLPQDINFSLGLNLDYDDLLIFCSLAKKYSVFCATGSFWKAKAIHDFHIDLPDLEELIAEIIAAGDYSLPEKETYIRLAGEHDIPILGAEKYGDVNELTFIVANKLDESKLFYFFQISKFTYIFIHLGNLNRVDLLNKFLQLYPQLQEPILNNFMIGAAESGNVTLVTQLLELGANYYAAAVYRAASSGHIKIIHLLIDKLGVDFNHAMYTAAFNGHINIVYYMLAYGANNFDECLDAAVAHKYYNIINLMLLSGATDYDEALSTAAYHGYRDIIALLIQKGIKDYDKALYRAAQGGFRDIVLDMINHGATDVNYGLIGAALGGHLDIIKELMKRGATNFYDALIEAIVEPEDKNLDIIKFLAEQVPDQQISHDFLFVVAGAGNKLILEYFFPYVKAQNYNSYALQAARFGNREGVKFFVEKGANNIDELVIAANKYPRILSYLNMITKLLICNHL